MPEIKPHKLHSLSQAIYQEHLKPSTKFFLHSRILKERDANGNDIVHGGDWEVKLYAGLGGKALVWSMLEGSHWVCSRFCQGSFLADPEPFRFESADMTVEGQRDELVRCDRDWDAAYRL
jgi:hypothetical protein